MAQSRESTKLGRLVGAALVKIVPWFLQRRRMGTTRGHIDPSSVPKDTEAACFVSPAVRLPRDRPTRDVVEASFSLCPRLSPTGPLYGL